MSFINIIAFVGVAYGMPDRISTIAQQKSQITQIVVRPGLVSVLEFPEPLKEVRVGDPKSAKISISGVSNRELTIYLKSSASAPTNLIVRTTKAFFVFDLIPSNVSHQDYIKITKSGSTNILKKVSSKPLKPARASISSATLEKREIGATYDQ